MVRLQTTLDLPQRYQDKPRKKRFLSQKSSVLTNGGDVCYDVGKQQKRIVLVATAIVFPFAIQWTPPPPKLSDLHISLLESSGYLLQDTSGLVYATASRATMVFSSTSSPLENLSTLPSYGISEPIELPQTSYLT